MITRLKADYVEVTDQSVIVDLKGIFYEIFISHPFIKNLKSKSQGDEIDLHIFHYMNSDQSRSIPVLIGFQNKIEKDFFIKFITVSGVGPRAALKALSVPISQIASAIDSGDRLFLKTLPGIGDQRAREIIAKLQGKVAQFCLLQDDKATSVEVRTSIQEEALSVLLQLQYRRDEANAMINRALQSSVKIKTVEDLLNEVYKQKAGMPIAT